MFALGCVFGWISSATPATIAPPLESLPVPAIDIPSDLKPPLAHGRNDVHGWLWLPIDNGAQGVQAGNVSELHGYFYHHTPEFWYNSPHNFEIMITATLKLDHTLSGMPLPPSANTIGTEYVFTPPAFSLDELITGVATDFYGHFTNGSFDTKQYIWMSNGTLTVNDRTTVHYLWDDNVTRVSPMKQQAYLSYPRAVQQKEVTVGSTSASNSSLVHLYWLHMLRRAPDYDQTVHVTIDTDSCTWRHGDSEADVIAVGATFGTSLKNDVHHRLHHGSHEVVLFTNRSRDMATQTTCNATVLEEVHCVVMPDSFAKCPPLPASH